MFSLFFFKIFFPLSHSITASYDHFALINYSSEMCSSSHNKAWRKKEAIKQRCETLIWQLPWRHTRVPMSLFAEYFGNQDPYCFEECAHKCIKTHNVLKRPLVVYINTRALRVCTQINVCEPSYDTATIPWISMASLRPQHYMHTSYLTCWCNSLSSHRLIGWNRCRKPRTNRAAFRQTG